MGLLNPVVQKTFKITTETITGTLTISPIALVQIDETGGYAVTSWIIAKSEIVPDCRHFT